MSGGQEEEQVDKKPNVVRSHINLRIASQDEGSEVLMRIKRDIPLKKVMNAYCEQRGVGFNTFAFLYHGKEIQKESTPEQLEMEDGDEIDAFLHVDGGAVC